MDATEPEEETNGVNNHVSEDPTVRVSARHGRADAESDNGDRYDGALGETYMVAPGDTLSSIAARFYGDSSQYMRIWEANRHQLDNPDVIYPGQTLSIPE
jgi:nucleoid-associated protein YgaU